MLPDVRGPPASPSKGKTREKTHWQTGWWNFLPLIEQPHRPVEWSRSSVIFTAHPTQPYLTARHFSSSKQFQIPLPSPILSSPGSYDPPSVISVAPNEDWLFAYFPRHDSDGTGCLWKRGAEVTSWAIKEWWSFPPGGGVVAAEWLGAQRDWMANYSGIPGRSPPRGPRTPVSDPTLLIVTQDHQVNICYFRHYIPSLKIIGCSLTQPGVTLEGQTHLGEDRGTHGKRCLRAAIGLSPNETSILIATRSYFCPPPFATDSQPETNITFPMDATHHSPLEIKSMEWEGWGEEAIINICEVQLKFDGSTMSLLTNPLPPILHASMGLIDLEFLCIPPPLLFSSSSELPPSPRKNSSEKGLFYLASTYLDFGDYTSSPKSEITVHIIARQLAISNNKSNKSVWTCKRNATRSFSSGVLTFIAPSPSLSKTYGGLLYAGIMETSGSLPRPMSQNQETPVGVIRVLNVADLSDSDEWENTPIMSTIESAGRDLPLNVVVSPSGTLLCTISSSLWSMKTAIHLLPRQKSYSSGSPIPPLAIVLATAILSRRSSSDIAHVLSLSSTPLCDTEDTLYHAIGILDGHQNGVAHSCTWRILGEAMAIYRAKASQASKDHERDNLTERWKVAHDICSLLACNSAFEDCRKEDAYDLDAVWQLIGLLSWVIAFTERLMKACVLSRDMYELSSPPPSPTLLHLVHPFALQNLTATLAQVAKFRVYLGSLSARAENAQIAREVLVDLVDSSGINLEALVILLEECLEDCQTLNGEDRRRALASCQPSTASHLHLDKFVKKLTQSTVLRKSTLFIKPFDLVDGVARLSVVQKKDQDKDVVSKRILVGNISDHICLRCAGGVPGKKHGHFGASVVELGCDEKLLAQGNEDSDPP